MEYLSCELAKLIESEYDNHDISAFLTAAWSISLSKERAEWFFYNCDSKKSCRSISEAIEIQNGSNSMSSDDDFSVSDECNIGSSSDDISENESQSRSLGSSSSANKNTDDPTTQIKRSTFDFLSTDTNKKERARHSRVGYRERIVRTQQKQINERNARKDAEDKNKIETLKCHNLFCCDEIDPVTKNRCICGPFTSAYFLKRHKQSCENGSSKHIFPSINSKTSILIDIQQGKTSPLCLACGALPNRDDAAAGIYDVKAPKSIPACIDPSCVEAGCYRRDNKTWRQKQFRATKELLKDLESLFQDGEDRSKGGAKRNAGKYTAVEAVAVLKNMIDLNGRRKYRIGGPFGKLPTVKYVKAWFGRRKNKGAKVFLTSSDSNTMAKKNDKFSCMTLEELQDEFEKIFECELTREIMCMKLLEIDDEMKHGSHDDIYGGLKLSQLQMECENRNLPFQVLSEGLQIILRSHSMKVNSGKHKSSAQYRNAVNITDATEQILFQRNAQSDDYIEVAGEDSYYV